MYGPKYYRCQWLGVTLIKCFVFKDILLVEFPSDDFMPPSRKPCHMGGIEGLCILETVLVAATMMRTMVQKMLIKKINFWVTQQPPLQQGSEWLIWTWSCHYPTQFISSVTSFLLIGIIWSFFLTIYVVIIKHTVNTLSNCWWWEAIIYKVSVNLRVMCLSNLLSI